MKRDEFYQKVAKRFGLTVEQAREVTTFLEGKLKQENRKEGKHI